jgi:hypothetical protein
MTSSFADIRQISLCWSASDHESVASGADGGLSAAASPPLAASALTAATLLDLFIGTDIFVKSDF